MLTSVPATGDGISVSTLSVDTSTSGSSTSTLSPTFFSQRVTVPSVTDSPSSGISTEVASPPPDDAAGFFSGSGSSSASGSGFFLGGRLGFRGRLLGRLLLFGGLLGLLLLGGFLGLGLLAAAVVLAGIADHGQLAADLDGVVLLGDDLLQHACGG